MGKLIYVSASRIHGNGCYAGVDLLPGITIPIPTMAVKEDHPHNVETERGPRRPYRPFCYLNHSNRPNAAIVEAEDGTLTLEILRVIRANKEILIHYGEEWEQ